MKDEVVELGSLDISLYSCISRDIDTPRVVVTNNQLVHMLQKHPEAYEETLIELKNTINDPDYIFRDDKHADTGLVIKELSLNDHFIYIVLRVCTNSENGKYANSILSGWKISKSRLENYIRNKTILYKRP